MMEPNQIVLGPATRHIARRWADMDGKVMRRPEEPKKRRIQEEKYHAMIADIAKQVDLLGERQDVDDAKRLLIDAFARVMKEAGIPLHQQGRIVPSLDGTGVVQLGIQSRHFWVAEASEFIEYLYAFGAMHNVRWSEKIDVPGWVREGAPA